MKLHEAVDEKIKVTTVRWEWEYKKKPFQVKGPAMWKFHTSYKNPNDKEVKRGLAFRGSYKEAEKKLLKVMKSLQNKGAYDFDIKLGI